MEKQEILKKLKTQQLLMREIEELHSAAGEQEAFETLDKIRKIRADIGAFPKKPAVTEIKMVVPPDLVQLYHIEDSQQIKNKLKIAGIGTVLCFVIGSIFSKLMLISMLLAVVGCLGIFLTIRLLGKYKEAVSKEENYRQETERKRAPFEKALKLFRESLHGYTQEVNGGIIAYRKYLDNYKDNYLRYEKVMKEYTENRNQIIDQLEQKEAELEKIAVVPPMYYHLVSDVIANLRAGRADDYKEALNLAIEEDRLRENERQRREEESRRVAIVEQQAEEARRHNQKMEQQQKEHDREMQRAEQERIKIEKDRAEAERRNADRMQREMEQARRDQVRAARQSQPSNYDRHMAMLRCNKCSKRNACTVKGNPNCGAFNPM